MKTIILAAAMSLTIAVPSGASTLTATYSAYYAFGDSLSDDGKLQGIIPFSPISDGGRFSNGPVWAEEIADVFTDAGRQSLNFALGGATATGEDHAGPARLATLSGQIGQFADIQSLGGLVSGDNPLVSVWMGANDLFAILDPVVSPAFDATGAARAVEANIRAIAALGAQFDDFLVVNLPDLGQSPAYSTLLGDPDGTGPAAMAASALTAQFNAQLALSVDSLRNDGFTVHTLDVATLFEQVLTGPLDGDLAAFQGMDLRRPCTISLTDPSGPTCDTPDSFFFADAVHPNRIVHDVIAGRAVEALAPIPLPAAGPLLLGGLLALGFATRRRAA